MERPTTDEAGGKGLEVEVASASQDANDLFRTGSVDAGTGISVDVGAGVDAVDEISLISGSVHGATISCWVCPSRG